MHSLASVSIRIAKMRFTALPTPALIAIIAVVSVAVIVCLSLLIVHVVRAARKSKEQEEHNGKDEDLRCYQHDNSIDSSSRDSESTGSLDNV